MHPTKRENSPLNHLFMLTHTDSSSILTYQDDAVNNIELHCPYSLMPTLLLIISVISANKKALSSLQGILEYHIPLNHPPLCHLLKSQELPVEDLVSAYIVINSDNYSNAQHFILKAVCDSEQLKIILSLDSYNALMIFKDIYYTLPNFQKKESP